MNRSTTARPLKVTLVFPSTDDDYAGLGRVYQQVLPPSNLALLAAVASNTGSVGEVVVLDCNQASHEDYLDHLDADFVGISNWSVNQRNTLRIARAVRARRPDALVVLGGPNASHVGARTLRHRNEVDCVVCGDGETALPALLSGAPFDAVPNLLWRDGDKIVRNQEQLVDLTSNPVFDFDSVLPAFHPSSAPVPVTAIRGCIKAARSEICSYCSLATKRVRVVQPALLWRQVAYLQQRYGISYFFETGDDFMVGSYPERLLRERPDSLSDATWRIYAYPENLDDDAMDLLARLGVRCIFLGVETVSGPVLERAGRRGYSAAGIFRIAQRARSLGIRLIASFIFGLDGESHAGLVRNREVIEELATNYGEAFEALSIAVATPVAGSALFNASASCNDVAGQYFAATGDDLASADIFDYELLTRLYVERIAGLDYQAVLDQVNLAEECVEQAGLPASTFMGVERVGLGRRADARVLT